MEALGSEPGSRHQLSLPPQLMAGLRQVQLEVQKKWQQWNLQDFPLRPVALSSSFSISASGPTHGTKGSPSEQSRGICRASVI